MISVPMVMNPVERGYLLRMPEEALRGQSGRILGSNGRQVGPGMHSLRCRRAGQREWPWMAIKLLMLLCAQINSWL